MVRLLFGRLLVQLCHWFSSSNALLKEARVLLDALTDGVGDATNPALRRLSAHGVAEFLRYAVKQRSKKQQAKAGGGSLTADELLQVPTYPPIHTHCATATWLNLPACLPVCLPACLPACLFACLPDCPCTCLPA